MGLDTAASKVPLDAAAPIIVLGASSLVGRYVLPEATGRGLSALGMGRGAGAGILADLAAPDLKDHLPDLGVVICTASLWVLPQALEALAARGMRRLVAFSSTSRFTKAQSKDAGERAVAERLRLAEEAVIAFCEARNMGWTLLRPTLIYAEGQDQNISRLAGLIRRFGFLPIAGAGQGRRQPVHGQDLARAALDAAASPAALNRAYDLPGGETLTYRAMAERVFAGLGRKPLILSVPLPLWRLGLTLAAPLLPGATSAMGERMAEDLVFDGGPAANDFGWSPRDFHPRF